MEQEMCIQFTVFLCNLNSAPCMRYDAVSNYGIVYGFFLWHPGPRCSGRAVEAGHEGWGCVCRTSALHAAGFGAREVVEK